MRRLVLENRRLRRAAADAEQDYPLLGETPVMVRLRDTIRQLASVDVDVLIEGETGTGKNWWLASCTAGARVTPAVLLPLIVLPCRMLSLTSFFRQPHSTWKNS